MSMEMQSGRLEVSIKRGSTVIVTGFEKTQYMDKRAIGAMHVISAKGRKLLNFTFCYFRI